MITVDRMNGLSGDLAIKAPVRVATTANITLHGTQTIDGISVAAGDRVLVKNQSDKVDNGVWNASTSSWSRALDFDGSYDVVKGTLVTIQEGTVNAGVMYRLTTSSPVIGTSELEFEVANDIALMENLALSSGATLVGSDDGSSGSLWTTVAEYIQYTSTALLTKGKVVASISTLKAVPKGSVNASFVLGYYASGDGGGGEYYYDASDTTTADNGGTVIVATDGGRWKLVHSGQVSVKQFGAKGDGSTNDTTAINAANTALTAAGIKMYWPDGTYPATNVPAIASMRWVGAGSTRASLKLINSTNPTALVSCASTDIDDVYIEGMRFDGNRANNTTGHVLQLYGCRHRIKDVAVANAPENGIITNWNSANGFREGGFEGFYSHITIDTCGKSGWVHNGPSDSHFESIVILDCGLTTDNTYYNLFLASGSGNGRFFNLHTWNRSTTTTVAASAVYVGSSGNNFSGCHFEGGTIPLSIAGSGNTFESCSYYAPRGIACVHLIGGSNKLSGSLGITYYSGNADYLGIILASANNQVDIVDLGCRNGCIYFATGDAQNFIKVTGNRSGTGYTGTPAATDDVVINIGGTAASKFVQRLT